MLFFRSQKESKARSQFPAASGFIAGMARELDNEKLRNIVGVYSTAKGDVEIKHLRSSGEQFIAQILHKGKPVGDLIAEISGMTGGLILELSPHHAVGSVGGSGEITDLVRSFSRYL